MQTMDLQQDLQQRCDVANKVYQELLTGVAPEVKQALVALQDLMEAELQLLKSQRTS